MADVLQFKNLDLKMNAITDALVRGSDDLFKCLKYASKDALSQTITLADKLKLVNQDDGIEDTRIFFVPYNKDQIEGKAQTQIRLYEGVITPFNLRSGEVQIAFDVVVHNSLVQMNGGKKRTNVIFYEILKVLNEQIIEINSADGGTTFQPKFGSGQRRTPRFFNDQYQGYTFTMTFEVR